MEIVIIECCWVVQIEQHEFWFCVYIKLWCTFIKPKKWFSGIICKMPNVIKLLTKVKEVEINEYAKKAEI